jgi:hypothetical protein
MSESHGEPGPAIGELHEIQARFSDPDALEDAVKRLELSGFDRADLSLPEVAPPPERATPESGAKPVYDDQDARQARTLHTSGAAAVAGMAAAGVVIATGGAAAPAVAAAIAGGGLAGGAVYALTSASNSSEQEDRELKAASGRLVLSVRTDTVQKRAEAESILRASGASELAFRGESAMAKQKDDERVDRAGEESFPASDAPASSGITGPRVARPPRAAPASDKRSEEARPKGTPTHERHASETAYQWEHEERAGRK